tara:strand:+ start:916 stop:1608 length:693 start_codon:yes stop_codon:yes gene_type:complete
LKKTKRDFPYDLVLRKKAICFKIKNLSFVFCKHNSLNKYLFNELCLQNTKLKFLILKQIAFLRNTKSYGKSLLVFFNTDINFYLVKNLLLKSFLTLNIENDIQKLLTSKFITGWKSKIYSYKIKAFKLLTYFTKFMFRKFKLRPRYKRLFVSPKKKMRFNKLLKKIKNFSKFLKRFILEVQAFLDKEFFNSSFLTEKKFIELRNKLNCDIDKDTKNYVLIAWLRDFLITF